MGWDAPWHWVVLAIVVIALFGYKKLPDAARSLGRSLRIFKTEIKGMNDDDAAREKKAIEGTAASQASTAAPSAPTAPVQPAVPVAPSVPAAGSEAPPSADTEVPATAHRESSPTSE